MNAAADPRQAKAEPSQPWWRFGIVWLVLAGPVAVVVAGGATVWLAVRQADPVIVEAPVPASEREASNAPALKVRNHAATPRQP
jgi:hypothetical protein